MSGIKFNASIFICIQFVFLTILMLHTDGYSQILADSKTNNSYRLDIMFPNEFDSGLDDTASCIPKTFSHFLSIPFNQSDKILRVYSEKPCFVDSIVGEWNGYGFQFLDRCHNREIRLVVYDPSKRKSMSLGIIRIQHGANYGGIFIPIALLQNDKSIILQAWMGSPGAGGGMVDYGYATMAVAEATNDTTSPEITKIANRDAFFYDDYKKVVYLGNSDKMPDHMQPGPKHNSGALYFRDLVSDNSLIILEEENTTYELMSIDTVNNTVRLKAFKYEYSDNCPKDENGYYCAKKTQEIRTIPLP